MERSHYKNYANSLVINTYKKNFNESKNDSFTEIDGIRYQTKFRKNKLGPKVFTTLEFSNKKYEIQVDEGSTFSSINPEFLKEIKDSVHRVYKVEPLHVATALNTLIVDDYAEIKFKYEGINTLWGFYVCKGFKPKMLLGTDWTMRNKISENLSSIECPNYLSKIEISSSEEPIYKF